MVHLGCLGFSGRLEDLRLGFRLWGVRCRVKCAGFVVLWFQGLEFKGWV